MYGQQPPTTKKVVRAEVVTDEMIISAINAASVPQMLLALHLGFGFCYAMLGLSTQVFFDFVGMRNWWCSTLGVLATLEIAGYILYLRRTRTQRRDIANPNLPSYIVGKPTKREIDLAVFLTIVTFAGTLWVCVQYVSAGHTADGVVGERADDLYTSSPKYTEYRDYLIAFLLFTIYGLQQILRALVAHCYPVHSVTNTTL